jgi:arabinogalactan oligomer / maltooligosaccharide transport system permease protein
MPLLLRLIIIFVVLMLWFVHQSTVVEYADKKGYVGIKPGIIGLFPLIGFIYYMKRPKRRNVSRHGLIQVFKPSKMFGRILIYTEIVLIAIIVIVPIVYIFGLALSNIQSAIPNRIWPETPTLGAFNYLFEETKFVTWYGNTLSIALINMFVGTILITGAAFVFARFSFKGKKAGLLTILVLQAFPSFMGLIAMYVLFWKFGLLGQPRALSILYIGGSIPGNLWLIKGFLSQIPKDLDESAMIDGANKLQIFIRIILPLSVPILTFVAVSMFMGPWMDYMLPNYLLNYYPPDAPANYDVTNQWTLAVGFFKFIDDPQYQHYSAFAAGVLLVGIPITILYMTFQRFLIEGIMAGATKG